jgi:predicted glycoside hydrolase/deacetylase ChbG (UPF0249 family)
MAIKKIFNADDFGISQGVNAAIIKAHKEGILSSASLMVNQKYAAEAVDLAADMPDLELGLHINLTNEYPASKKEKIPLLVNENGKFKHGFVNLLLLSIFRRKEFSKQIETEIRAQVQKYYAFGLKLNHIDGHRHVHLIPAVFKIVKKIAAENDVKRIRTMNENLFNTIKQNKDKSYLFDGGLIKYFVLRTLTFWNGYKSDVYFYTILYTCKITKERFNNIKIPHGFKAVEIMIHPSIPEIDRQNLSDVWDENILSEYRTKELETLLDKNVINGIN